jgi:hypothetical protein
MDELSLDEDSVSEMPKRGDATGMDNQWLYIQMELCNTSLRQWLDARDKRAKLDMDVLHNLMKEVGEGVRFMHAEGFIHRDIKPGTQKPPNSCSGSCVCVCVCVCVCECHLLPCLAQRPLERQEEGVSFS